MKTYKSILPEITLKLKKGDIFKAQIKSSKDAEDMFRQIWDNDSLDIYESVVCIFLNRGGVSIGWFKVSQGGLSSTVIDNRLILATALKSLASSIIMAHNHPSGNLVASQADIDATIKLKNAGDVVDIQLLDHLIITSDGYTSMADNGII